MAAYEPVYYWFVHVPEAASFPALAVAAATSMLAVRMLLLAVPLLLLL